MVRKQEQSPECAVCKREFSSKIPFGHRFRSSWGAIDVCELCTEDIYMTVMADVAGGMFSLRRDIAELKSALAKLARGKPKMQ